MTREQTILFGVLAAAIIAALAYKRLVVDAVPVVAEYGVSQTAGNSDFAGGPAYLNSATPWLFSPAIGISLPNVTTGQVGQVANVNQSEWAAADCGCGIR